MFIRKKINLLVYADLFIPQLSMNLDVLKKLLKVSIMSEQLWNVTESWMVISIHDKII